MNTYKWDTLSDDTDKLQVIILWVWYTFEYATLSNYTLKYNIEYLNFDCVVRI